MSQDLCLHKLYINLSIFYLLRHCKQILLPNTTPRGRLLPDITYDLLLAKFCNKNKLN